MELNTKGTIEAILFSAGNPVEVKDLQLILEKSKPEIEEIIKADDTYQMASRKEYYDSIYKIIDKRSKPKLSNAALETLSIIAYNGPITRVMVDEIRGVSSAHIIRKLVFKNLIKEVGRSELPGKPILYSVTDQFLDYFGLKSIEDLPKIEIEENIKETELYDSKYHEE